MGLSFLAPLFFAGAGLLAIPYFIHQIRRPERETTEFSSLLFIPDERREVIERRRVEHIFLMLLRMLFLLFLALAFTRPYWKALAAHEQGQEPHRHVVLLDTSYSMGRTGVFDRAKQEALDLLERLGANDAVAVIEFARAPRLLSSFTGADAHERAKRAIQGAVLTENQTAYLPALQFAQAHLGTLDSEDQAPALRPGALFHVISDFKKNGMPKQFTAWKLSPAIELDLIAVGAQAHPGSGAGANRAVSDVAIRRTAEGRIRILAKVKNWSDVDVYGAEVALYVGGQKVESKQVSVRARNASQVPFQWTPEDGEGFDGYLQLEDDSLSLDNRRYFAWSTPLKQKLVLASSPSAERWPAAMFFERALAGGAGLPWTPLSVDTNDLTEHLTNPALRPSVVVWVDATRFDAGAARAALQYVQDGGDLLITLGESVHTQALNTFLLEALGVYSLGPAHENIRPERFAVLSWADLDHPIFMPFRGAKFNDFSALRFYNHQTLEIRGDRDSVSVIARFDDGSPAMAEIIHGEGRIIVWPFSLALNSTNFAKNARFVPLLYETLIHLTDWREDAAARLVGERIAPDALARDDEGKTVVQVPGRNDPLSLEAVDAQDSTLLTMEKSGFFRTRAPADGQWRHTEAVNVLAAEADPIPISLAEFEHKLAASHALVKPADVASTDGVPAGYVIQEEYGRIILIIVFSFLVLESGCMLFLKRVHLEGATRQT